MKELQAESLESSQLVDQTFDFWFNSRGHIRSPFPEYIRTQLKTDAVERFYQWTAQLSDKVEKEVNEEIIGEKFEEIIFETAMNLVLTEDEKLTINYPFMPRIGDVINKNDDTDDVGESIIKDRSIEKSGDHVFLKVKLQTKNTQELWETQFELPA